MRKRVFVERCRDYRIEVIKKVLTNFDELFREYIKPGQTVVLKPNWIAPYHKYDHSKWESVITHPNFISCILEKIITYLKGSGKIIIADAPQTDSNFDEILARNPVSKWKQLAEQTGVKIQIIDLRDYEWVNEGDLIVHRRKLHGDPMGSVEFNLRGKSEFVGHKLSSKGYFGADYNTKETTRAHSKGNHIYRIAKTAVNADVFINLPKLKTHKKSGITCALKNLVGINTYKNYLPHHTEGTPAMGGDQFPNNTSKNFIELVLMQHFRKILLYNDRFNKCLIPVKGFGKKIFGETKTTIRSGNWYGNDTLWRTILDLNKLLLYGKSDGKLRPPDMRQQKPYLTFVDGIIGGEGNGPEAPDEVSSNLIIAGSSPVSVDCVAARLMGFDYLKIPMLRNAFTIVNYPIVDFKYDKIKIYSKTTKQYCGDLTQLSSPKSLHFRPHFGWIGHIEL